jgi:hypothetical protein
MSPFSRRTAFMAERGFWRHGFFVDKVPPLKSRQRFRSERPTYNRQLWPTAVAKKQFRYC